MASSSISVVLASLSLKNKCVAPSRSPLRAIKLGQ
jgi:hypothetical protein